MILRVKQCFNIKNKDIVQFEENNKSRKQKLNAILNISEYPNLMLYVNTC